MLNFSYIQTLQGLELEVCRLRLRLESCGLGLGP